MEKIASIRENDDMDGRVVAICIMEDVDAGQPVWRVICSNGEDPCLPLRKTREESCADVRASWGGWATFEERNKKVFRIGDRVALSGGRTGTIVQLSGKKVKLAIAGESARWIDKVKI